TAAHRRARCALARFEHLVALSGCPVAWDDQRADPQAAADLVLELPCAWHRPAAPGGATDRIRAVAAATGAFGGLFYPLGSNDSPRPGLPNGNSSAHRRNQPAFGAQRGTSGGGAAPRRQS